MRQRPRGKRAAWTPPANSLTLTIESAGNARMIDRSGDVRAVIEDWRLWVDGKDVGEVSNYHEAVQKAVDSIT